MATVNLSEKLAAFDDHWNPRIVGELNEEFLIVPRGVEHRPVADEEVEVLLFEPASTLNTGNVQNELTRPVLQRM